MASGDTGLTQHELAMAMRDALRQARWTPDDDPSRVVSVLKRMSTRITGLASATNPMLVLNSEQLADVYAFAGSVLKTVDQDHPATHPRRRDMSTTEFLDDVRRQFSQFHRRQRELLQALEQMTE